jgi:hypothetical protein
MGLFTVEFELGPETRGMVERVAARTCAAAEKVATTAIVQVELGEQTREMLGALAVPGEGAGKAREAVGGIVKKARDEAKRVSKS